MQRMPCRRRSAQLFILCWTSRAKPPQHTRPRVVTAFRHWRTDRALPFDRRITAKTKHIAPLSRDFLVPIHRFNHVGLSLPAYRPRTACRFAAHAAIVEDAAAQEQHYKAFFPKYSAPATLPARALQAKAEALVENQAWPIHRDPSGAQVDAPQTIRCVAKPDAWQSQMPRDRQRSPMRKGVAGTSLSIALSAVYYFGDLCARIFTIVPDVRHGVSRRLAPSSGAALLPGVYGIGRDADEVACDLLRKNWWRRDIVSPRLCVAIAFFFSGSAA